MIKIGITGHRNLDEKFIENYKQKVSIKLKKLKKEYSEIILYSALADGADRLIVYEAIKLDIKFVTILPMKKDVYENDFNTISKIEFDKLLNKAYSIVQIAQKNTFSKDIQYELSGHYISDNSDLLFALWDGKDTGLQGGTSEIVKYHLKNKKEIFHIKVDRNDILLKSHHDT
jgi:uncharacterized protein YihD (DUF1040 family)